MSRVLSAAGVLPTRINSQLYVKRSAIGELLILLPAHIDDFKITGKHDEVDALLDWLNKEFDQLKLEVSNTSCWTTEVEKSACGMASLQKKLQQPCARDISNLSRVLRYLKAKPLSVLISRLEA